jgi:hypothetical protein
MVWRVIVGGVLCLIGLVWIAQGLNVLKGSAVMSGHIGYTFLGLIVAVIGVALIVWGTRSRVTTE